jgi:hypothetical protein
MSRQGYKGCLNHAVAHSVLATVILVPVPGITRLNNHTTARPADVQLEVHNLGTVQRNKLQKPHACLVLCTGHCI